ncbi:MAG: hypothetical protein H6937_08370 [Burkholderiales bacterium]|jgi:hypothetical protein|nr:hypothetical protein [Burkholderiales bacterium]
MITKLLTIFAPLHYSGNASAKSEAGFGSPKSKRMFAAMRHFLCPKKVFALLFNGRICAGGFGLPVFDPVFQPAFICPPQPQGL